jgi:hypothetical protein
MMVMIGSDVDDECGGGGDVDNDAFELVYEDEDYRDAEVEEWSAGDASDDELIDVGNIDSAEANAESVDESVEDQELSDDFSSLSTSRYFRLVAAGDLQVLGKRVRPPEGQLRDSEEEFEFRTLKEINRRNEPMVIQKIDISSRFLPRIRGTDKVKCLLVRACSTRTHP